MSEHVQIIMSLVNAGKTYGQVAALTGYSRSAIAGYVNRNRTTKPNQLKTLGKCRQVVFNGKEYASLSDAARSVKRSDRFIASHCHNAAPTP